MSDFYQSGVVTTLHRLGEASPEMLESQLERFVHQQPIALVLPALYSEFEKPAMERILRELSVVRYVDQFILTLGSATEKQFHDAQERVAGLPGNVRVLWNDGKRVQELYRILEENGLHAGTNGKGRSCWMAYGYALGSRRADCIALHDCDIVNYSREMLARLCYPVVNPNINFEFCKAFYARVSDRMHGRVTRLFVTPLLRSLISLFGNLPLLEYLDSFRYPLAGEFAMQTDLARANRIPSDWGLEVGVLAEVYRNCSVKRVCQVDIAENYEHKHQELSQADPSKGLMKMSVDIAKSLFRILSAEEVTFDTGRMQTLWVRYRRMAEDTITRYHADAMINALTFDRHEEETAVETFAHGLKLATEEFFADPLGMPLIPNWNRITSALPGFLGELCEAVDADNRSLIARKREVQAVAS
ncbi:MAG: glycosyl transferase [Acidobacteria bacterium]|nr:glycosyl transferase [Acidobacteriota bacterium]